MITAREYLRVSQDRSGRARSVEEQHDDNVRAGDRHGFTINGAAYSDVSISASRYTTKVRGGFARLMDDLNAARFSAGILVLWESSRGSRRVGEWASLVDALEDAEVLVHVTTHGRTYNPANPRDRRSLLEDAIDAEYDSGKKSEAVLRAAAATAARGEPHGRIPFGYQRRYDPLTRRVAAQEPHPAEAPIVREIYARLHRGDTLKNIARDFDRRGIRTRTGKPFTPGYLRDIALRPIYGGWRIHEPGNRTGRYHGSLDGAVKAAWPALVDGETFGAVRAMLLSPERKTSRPGRGKHLLSMIARCDKCGGPMCATTRRDHEAEYFCRDHSHVYMAKADLDTYAEEVMLGHLANPDVIEKLRSGDGSDAGLAAVRGDLEIARAELTALRDAGSKGKLTVATVIAMEPALAARVDQLEARERELAIPPALSGIMAPGEDVARRWAAADMPARRMVARLLLSPRILGELRVTRTPVTGHRVPAHERVRWARDSSC
jgi:site-specific DNA recombinase